MLRQAGVSAITMMMLTVPAWSAPAPGAAPDSPRACVGDYLELARKGRYQDAARYLWLTPEQATRGAELARRLKAVIDRHVGGDASRLSSSPEGDVADGLPEHTDAIGAVGEPSDRVLVIRHPGQDPPAWRFAPSTVERIDSWYGALEDRWVRDHLPDVLLRTGPKGLLWWQWLALPLLVALAWAVSRPLAAATRAVFGRIVAKTEETWDDELLARLGAPISFAWMLAVVLLLLPWLALFPPARAFAQSVLRAAALVTVFWALWRTVDSIGRIVGHASWVLESHSARSLLALAVRAGKVLVLAVGLVSALSQLGYPVAGLIAGLGVGGLAVALAAQKTVENLFGSISLAVDQPFRVGDFVKVDDFTGHVESIGLRSTRFRTLDRTIVTVPNGRLADMRIESFAPRDRLRLALNLGLVYGTTSAQVQEILRGIEDALRAQPKLWPEGVTVRLKELGTSALQVEVAAWFDTADWNEFLQIREELLLKLMDVVERAGTTFAFPGVPIPGTPSNVVR